MSSDSEYPNPITASFRVLNNYRSLLPEALRRQGEIFDEETRKEVMDRMAMDRGILFSLNASPPEGAFECRDFLLEKGLDERLAGIIREQFGTENPRLYAHQEEAISRIVEGGGHGEQHTVVATGTGSGKTEAFLVPILDHCLNHPRPGVKALLVYPMNALANDQLGRIADWTDGTNVRFGTYVGATPESLPAEESDEKRRHEGHLVTRAEVREEPPDILLTNYVMLDYMLTRGKETSLFAQSAETLQYLVLDEVHTYRGTKATHLMHLLRRLEHRLATEPTKIATSATLLSGSDERQQAYMRGSRDALDQFIKPLLGVSNFNYVSLEDDEDSADVPPDEGEKRFTEAGELDWFFGSDVNEQQTLVEALTGIELRGNIFADLPAIYDALAEDAFVRSMKRKLRQNACSFQELVRLLRDVHPLRDHHNAEQVVKAYLSAISLINRFATDREPLLDFRMHLFLRDIGGHLKKCLHCEDYHSGGQDVCPECGNPLFTVYRDDIDKCVARITERHLSYDLRPASNETKKPVYVLLSRRETEADEEAFGIADPAFAREQASIDYAEEGEYQIELLDGVTNFDDAAEHLIPLRDPYRDYDYLSKLAQSLLNYDPNRAGKLLGFVDSRERVSRYGAALRDDFASAYLRAWLRKTIPSDYDLPTVAKLLAEEPSEEPDSNVEADILAEKDLWFARLTGRPAQGSEDYLELNIDQPLSDLECEVLEGVFLRERAIDREGTEDSKTSPYYAFYQRHPETPPEDSDYIRMSKYLAVRRNGAYIEKGSGGEKPNETGFALTSGKNNHEAFLEGRVQEVQQAIRDLCNKGVLCKRRVSGGHTHYYLRPRCVTLRPERLPVAGYDDRPEDANWNQLRQRLLRTADSHSSERDDEARRDIESAFDDGDLNVLVATPTLEMGVDIGELQTVMMVGVPPMPSNYAQRAGRAGRNRDDGQALIVTFCFDQRSHDAYYFGYPTRMVDGYVTPPVFNEAGIQVAQKHLNAWMVEGHAGSKRALRDYAANVTDHVSEHAAGAEALFGGVEGFDVDTYLREHFPDALGRQVERFSENSSPQRLLYQNGFFPDYSFRKDQIPLVEAEHIGEEAADETMTLQDRALSERAPELAYYKFSPGTDVYVGGRMLQIRPDAPHDLEEIDGRTARSYRCFAAEPQEQFANPYGGRTIFDRSELFSADFDTAPAYEKKPLTVRHLPSCELAFRNDGPVQQSDTERFSDEEGNPFSVGYRFEREALLLSLDQSMWQNESLIVSLAFAIDRTVKDHYGLDEGELRMLVEPEHVPGEEQDEDDLEEDRSDDQHHVLFYDYDGNANVPFEAIFEALADERLSHKIYERLTTCSCEAGCYLCMRSYSTQFHADAIDKDGAVMCVNYLRGEGRFKPNPPPAPSPQGRADVELTVSVMGDGFKIEGDSDEYEAAYDTEEDDYNTVLFDLLSEAVWKEWTPDKHTLSVVSKNDHVVNAINEHEVSKGRDAFARLLFQMLRFRHVSAHAR